MKKTNPPVLPRVYDVPVLPLHVVLGYAPHADAPLPSPPPPPPPPPVEPPFVDGVQSFLDDTQAHRDDMTRAFQMKMNTRRYVNIPQSY